MLRQSRSSILPRAFLTFCFLITAVVTTVHAAQKSSVDVRDNEPARIYGKVTEIIATESFTYIEVETGKSKVWAAGPVTLLKKGEMVSFTTMMPMRNYHSKPLGRDFSVLYITNSFKTAKEHSGSPAIPADTSELSIGDYLGDATLDGLSGKTKTFAAFKGKPLIINVWASWCGPCRAEMASLQRLAHRYNGKAFNIIGISTDDFRDKAKAVTRQAGFSFENFIDHELVLEKMLGAKTIPLTVLVAADGRVLKKINGARSWDSPEMIATIGNVFQVKLQNK